MAGFLSVFFAFIHLLCLHICLVVLSPPPPPPPHSFEFLCCDEVCKSDSNGKPPDIVTSPECGHTEAHPA